jgi:hypothetical protein
MTCSLHLNFIQTLAKLATIDDDDLFFSQIASNYDAIMFSLKNELQLF